MVVQWQQPGLGWHMGPCCHMSMAKELSEPLGSPDPAEDWEPSCVPVCLVPGTEQLAFQSRLINQSSPESRNGHLGLTRV